MVTEDACVEGTTGGQMCEGRTNSQLPPSISVGKGGGNVNGHVG